MARLFPLRSDAPTTDGTPRVVDLDDEDADDVFSALSSTTARRIYATLDADPGTPSDVAEAIDSSIQNVRYHLDKLEDAGLVEVVDTWYSSRGNEMSVYATANGPLIVTSDESRAAQLKRAVSRYVGGIGVLAAASFALQAAALRFGGEESGADGVGEYSAGDGGAGGSDAEIGDDMTIASNEGSLDAGDGSDQVVADGGGASESDGLLDTGVDFFVSTIEAFAALDSPGLLFFLGGVVVLTALVAVWYVETYNGSRPAR
ncbi:ArsR/SmtB family transcription factor [Halovivax cerinus]|uniref:ArsR/SmtB family transcription factor n=1 Tax=Halovivax cerinus TaxID=1487865 RepID=A0ABD5NN53_9EURY|nr:helix-turn-helix domain-containing protein [Halovivax cerinus]